MEKCQDYAAYLREHGLKSTGARNLVLSVLADKRKLLTAEEIFQAVRAGGAGINFSTVYRILELFTEKGLVDKSNFPGTGQTVFTLCCQGHVHHLICLRCKKTVVISQCPLVDFERRVAEDTDFVIVGHNLELYGYCKECRHILDTEKGGF